MAAGSGQHTHLIAAVFGIHRCPADAVPEVDRNILAVGSLGEWGLIAVLRRCALRIKSHESLARCRIKLLHMQHNRLGPRAAKDAHPTRVAHGRAGLRVGGSRARIGKNIQDRRSETRGRGCKQEQERAVRRHYWLFVVSTVEARQSTRTSAQHTFQLLERKRNHEEPLQKRFNTPSKQRVCAVPGAKRKAPPKHTVFQRDPNAGGCFTSTNPVGDEPSDRGRGYRARGQPGPATRGGAGALGNLEQRKLTNNRCTVRH